MFTTTATTESQRAVAKIFNSAIAAHAIPAAWEVGLLDELDKQKSVNVPTFAASHDLDSDSMLGLAVSLAVVDVVKHNDTTITPGPLFDDTFRTKSMFHWLTLGSGGLFTRTQHVIRKPNRVGDFHTRDAAAIAYACRELNRQFYDPVFWGVMRGLPFTPTSVVDLGCGSGERLMQILAAYPDAKALGIDAAGGAIGFAEGEASKRGFGSRLSFSVGDARALEGRPEFSSVDLLTSFLMGHDFWPRDKCISTLRTFRRLFPSARRFLLGDETRGLLWSEKSKPPVTVGSSADDTPIFALGLELGHVLMDVYIPTMQEWEGVFEEGGWKLVKAHELSTPRFAAIFELEPLD